MILNSAVSALLPKVIDFGPILLSLLVIALLIIALVTTRNLRKETRVLIIASIAVSALIAIIAFLSLFVYA